MLGFLLIVGFMAMYFDHKRQEKRFIQMSNDLYERNE